MRVLLIKITKETLLKIEFELVWNKLDNTDRESYPYPLY